MYKKLKIQELCTWSLAKFLHKTVTQNYTGSYNPQQNKVLSIFFAYDMTCLE